MWHSDRVSYSVKERRAGQAQHAEAVSLIGEEEQQQVHNGSKGQGTGTGPKINRFATIKVIKKLNTAMHFDPS